VKVSSKSRYGLKACFVLALHETETIPIGELVKGSQVTQKYLEKILSMLVKAEILATVRGVNGGYRLAKRPDDITVGAIFRVLEDNLEISDCSSGCTDEYCPNRNIMRKLGETINSVLDSYTLADLVKDNTCACSGRATAQKE